VWSGSSSSAKKIDAFLPTIPLEPLKGSQEEDDWPLFPGTVFAASTWMTPLPILKCTGVVNIGVVDGKPRRFPRAARQHRCSSAASCNTIRADDHRGDDGRGDARSAAQA